MSRSRKHLRGAVPLLVAVIAISLSIPDATHAASTGPQAPGAFHLHTYCSATPAAPTTIVEYPAVQPGMTCWTQYYCISSAVTHTVVRVAQPNPSLACYDTLPAAYAAMGYSPPNSPCSLTVASDAKPGVYRTTCANGMVVSISVGTSPGSSQGGNGPEMVKLRFRKMQLLLALLDS